jgi:hypothetical protein
MQHLAQSTNERLLALHLSKNRLAEVIWGTVIRRTVADEGGD